MENSIITQYPSIVPGASAPIPFNATKRKWSSVLSSSDSPTLFHDNLLSQIEQHQQQYNAPKSIAPVCQNPSSPIMPLRFPTLDKGNVRNLSRSSSSSQTPTRDTSPSTYSQEPNSSVDRSSSVSFSLIVGVLASEMMVVKETILKSIRSKLSEQCMLFSND